MMEQVLNEIFRVEYIITPILMFIALGVGGTLWYEFWLWKETRKGGTVGSLLDREFNLAYTHSIYAPMHKEDIQDYFNADAFLGTPESIDGVTAWFTSRINTLQESHGKFDRVAFIEKKEGPVGVLSLKDMISASTGIPAIIVRVGLDYTHPQLKIVGKSAIHHESSEILKKDEKVLVISDVLTTGGTVLEAVGILRECGVDIKESLVLFDREEQFGHNQMAEYGINWEAFKLRSEIPKQELSAQPV